MAVKRKKKGKRSKRSGGGGGSGGVQPHKKIRSSCKHCPKPGHDHVPGTGNSHRFHGKGAFCATHRTTKIGRQYCKLTGIRFSKSTSTKSSNKSKTKKSKRSKKSSAHRRYTTYRDRGAARRGDVGYSKKAYRRLTGLDT